MVVVVSVVAVVVVVVMVAGRAGGSLEAEKLSSQRSPPAPCRLVVSILALGSVRSALVAVLSMLGSATAPLVACLVTSVGLAAVRVVVCRVLFRELGVVLLPHLANLFLGATLLHLMHHAFFLVLNFFAAPSPFEVNAPSPPAQTPLDKFAHALNSPPPFLSFGFNVFARVVPHTKFLNCRVIPLNLLPVFLHFSS
jgi:hypothetical protein